MEAYQRRFEAAISTSELAKCNTTTHIESNKTYTDGDNKDGTKRFQEMCLIMYADSDQYSRIWNDLMNSTILGTENYPKTTTAAYNVMFCYNKPAPPRQVHAPHASVTLVQSGDTEKTKTTPGNDGRSFPEVTCYFYKKTVHHAGNFPSLTDNTRTGT